MEKVVNRLFRGDKVIWLIFALLCVVSVVEGFSAMGQLSYKSGNYWTPIIEHTVFLLIGLAAMLLIQNIPYRFFSFLIVVLPFAFLLLIYTMLFGVEVNGARRWVRIFGFSLQSSEIAKLALMVSVAFLLSKRTKENAAKIFYWIIGITALICGVIFKDNASTAAFLFALILLMLIIGRLEVKKIMVAIVVLVFVWVGLYKIGVYYLDEDNKDKSPKITVAVKDSRIPTLVTRTDAFFFDEKMPLDSTYQINDAYQVSHAKIAVARGGLFGRFPGNSQQRDFLPYPYSDFIYVIILEEIGLLGGIFVMFLFFFLLFRIGLLAGRCKRSFARYLLYGCGLILVMQALANMAVAVNIMPVTGQPLPLISRGGTSIVITCIYLGIILSVSRFEIGLGEDIEVSEESNEDIMAEKVSDSELLTPEQEDNA